jgi:hypothetical protein
MSTMKYPIPQLGFFGDDLLIDTGAQVQMSGRIFPLMAGLAITPEEMCGCVE